MSDAFGQITQATVTFVDRYQLPGGSIGQTPVILILIQMVQSC